MTPKAHRLLASLLAWCLLAFGGLEASAAEIPGLAASTSSGRHIYDDAVTTTAPSLFSVDSLNDLRDAAQHFYAGSEPVYAGLGHCLAAKGLAKGVVKLFAKNSGRSAAAASSVGEAATASTVGNAARGGWSPGTAAARKVPSGWGSGTPTRKGGGTRWTDPKKPGNGVRIDAGNPANSQVTQQVDHVVVRHNGQVIGRSGQPISGSIADNAGEAHIPLSEWLTWSSWNSR
jgi:hypothetical protein